MLRRCLVVFVLISLVWLCVAPAQQPVSNTSQPVANQTSANDPHAVVEQIKAEGMTRSQVMQTLSYLSDVIGPRLTNSPNMRRANEWTRDQMTKWGLQNAHLEAWGPFGRGWSLKRFSAQVIEPQAIPLIAFPKAWSPGLPGPLTAEVVYVEAENEVALAKYKGQLKGKIVFTAPTRAVPAKFEAPGTRLNEKELLTLADAPEPKPYVGRRNYQLTPAQRAAFAFGIKKLQFFQEEGVALLVDPARGDGGTIFVQSASVPLPPGVDPAADALRALSPYDKNAPKNTPQIVLAIEHYNRIMRMIQAGEHVKVAVELAVDWQDSDLMGYNTIAEIPGTDLKDELVMLGGHMDSWHAGTGATDNAAGCAVAMEAVRIIQTLSLKPRRTIRIALWSGEEQGLLGSKAYISQHFGKLETSSVSSPGNATGGDGDGATNMKPMPPKLVTLPEYERFSAYFNLDNGTGKIRGVYLQGNEAVRSIFREWLMPFRDRPEDKAAPVWGASTLSLSNTGGTDHLSFDAIGLPGFQFIQDEIEYDTRTHHSNQDVFDRIQGDDMKQSATIMAWFVYSAAMRDEKLPRKVKPGQQ